VNGAHLRTGDVYGSGTVSGPAADQCGSLMELSWNGTRSIDLGTGGSRTFLEDGDEVVLRAASAGPSRVQLGEVRGAVRPAPSPAG
jgi:fumarylacetoacetase